MIIWYITNLCKFTQIYNILRTLGCQVFILVIIMLFCYRLNDYIFLTTTMFAWVPYRDGITCEISLMYHSWWLMVIDMVMRQEEMNDRNSQILLLPNYVHPSLHHLDSSYIFWYFIMITPFFLLTMPIVWSYKSGRLTSAWRPFKWYVTSEMYWSP